MKSARGRSAAPPGPPPPPPAHVDGSASPPLGGSTSRSAKVNASLAAYVAGLTKRAEVLSSSGKRPVQTPRTGPILAPLTARTAATAAARNHPPPEEKSARSPSRSKTASAAQSKATSRSTSRAPSAASRRTVEFSDTVQQLSERPPTRPTNTSESSSRPQIAPTSPVLPPYSLQRSLAAATDAVIAKHGVAAPTPTTALDPNASFASQTKDQQRTSMRPWFLNIQEANLSTGRSHRRTRAMHEQMSRTRNWGRQVREIVDLNEQTFSRRGKAEMDELNTLNTDLVKRQEISELQLECIAGVFDLTTRARMKKARQMNFVSADHPTLRRIETEKKAVFEEMWSRSHVRRMHVKEEFCTSWEVLNFFGTRLNDQAQKMIQASTRHSALHLAKLRAQVPGHITKQHAMQMSLQEIGTSSSTTSHAAAPAVFANTPGIGLGAGAAPVLSSALPLTGEGEDTLSDFVFTPSGSGEPDNVVSLRLPTSISGAPTPPGASGIDPLTGVFNPALVRHAAPTSNNKLEAADIAKAASDRNYTGNRESLSLIHGNMTLIHTAAPQLNPSWVTLCCASGPKLLPRSSDQLTSSPGYTLIYDELLVDLHGLQHREHVVDMLEQALKNFKQVMQINTDRARWAMKHAGTGALSAFYGAAASPTSPQPAGAPVQKLAPVPALKLGATAGDSPIETSTPIAATAEEAEDLSDPKVMSRKLRVRVTDLCLDLECCGFGSDLTTFRTIPAATSPNEIGAVEDDSMPALKSLAKQLLGRFASRSRYYSKFYFEVHSPSRKNSWFAGFILVPPPLPSTALSDASAGDSSAVVAPREFSVLDVDFYSTTQLTLALHNDGSTFVSGHSRRVLPPLHDATVIGFALDLIVGTIHFTVDGQQPQIIFGVGASMYTVAEQRQQAQWICSQQLRPCFGLLGPKIKLTHVNRLNMKDGERERARLAAGLDSAGNPLAPKPTTQRPRHALTAHSSLPADSGESEAAGTIFARDGDATSTEDAQAAAARAALQQVADGTASTSHLSSNQTNDGLVGWVVPKLSVNLGEFEFLYLPQGLNLGIKPLPTVNAAPTNYHNAWQKQHVVEAGVGRDAGYNFGLGACLPSNAHEAPQHDVGNDHDNSLLQAFTAMKRARQMQQAAQQAAREKTTASVTKEAPVTLAAAAAPQSIDDAVLDYKHRQSTAALQAIDALRQEMLARPSADDLKKQIEEQRSAFFKSLSSSRLVSWSHFPPQSVRVQQAVLKVQRIARRYIGFKARRALWNKLSLYASVIQRCFRLHRLRKNEVFIRAIVPIQRLWRGFKARRMVKLLHKYDLTYTQANSAAVRIQSFCRMLLARKKVLVLACVVQQKIEQIKGLVIFVQRMWRQRLQKRTAYTNKAMLSSVLIFQARIRGIRLRRMLATIDPNAARQLKQLAINTTVKHKRWAAAGFIQRIFRGYLGRKYAKAKRNMIERDCARLRDCWRAFQLRQRIDAAFRGVEAEHLKTFFSALNWVGQEAPTANVTQGLLR